MAFCGAGHYLLNQTGRELFHIVLARGSYSGALRLIFSLLEAEIFKMSWKRKQPPSSDGHSILQSGILLVADVHLHLKLLLTKVGLHLGNLCLCKPACEGVCTRGQYYDALHKWSGHLSGQKNVLNKIYCFEKCLLDLNPIDLYAYQ